MAAGRCGIMFTTVLRRKNNCRLTLPNGPSGVAVWPFSGSSRSRFAGNEGRRLEIVGTQRVAPGRGAACANGHGLRFVYKWARRGKCRHSRLPPCHGIRAVDSRLPAKARPLTGHTA